MGKTKIKWFANMSRYRNIYLTYQDSGAAPKVTEGCFQGGVLSPLLWCMVVDSLLQQLNAEGYRTQGCADDFTMVVVVVVVVVVGNT